MGCGSSHLVEEEHHYNPEQATLPPDFVQLPKSVLQAEQQLLNAWGGAWTTTGYTDGHHCIKSDDTSKAEQAGASLLYGEVLPAGMAKLLDRDHLDVQRATSLIDLGSGCGRIATLAFLAYPSLTHVYAVELSPSRHALAAEAARRLVELQPSVYQLQVSTASRVRIVQKMRPSESQSQTKLPSEPTSTAKLSQLGKRQRILDISCGDMWRVPSSVLRRADIVLMHTEFTAASAVPFKRTVAQMKPTARFVTYNDPTVWYLEKKERPPFVQLEANVPESDTFLTSWSTSRGHHLFTWRRVALPGRALTPSGTSGESQEDGDEVWAGESKRSEA